MKSFTQYHNEEVEQIDEVSKKSLKRYISKATDDKKSAYAHDYRYHDFSDEEPSRDHDQDSKDYDRAEKREKGIDLARAKVNKSGKSGRAIAKVKANEEVELDEAKGLESALRKLVPGYGSRQALERNSAHWEVVNTLSRTKNEPEDKVRAKSLRHFKAAQKYSNILFKQRSLPEEVEQTLEEGNAENKQLRRAVDRKVGQTWLKRDSFSDVERKTTSPLKMGRGVNRFAKSETYKTLAKGKQVEEEMKSFKEHANEQIDEAVEGMTKKQHAEKLRELKAHHAKVKAEHEKVNAMYHESRDKVQKAEEAIEKHRHLDKSWSEKKYKRDKESDSHAVWDQGRQAQKYNPRGGW